MHVVFLDTVHEILEERLVKAGYSCEDATHLDKNACMETIASANGLVVRSRFPMDADFLDGAPHLQFIARSGAGMEKH